MVELLDASIYLTLALYRHSPLPNVDYSTPIRKKINAASFG
jgi:hypothetical protein